MKRTSDYRKVWIAHYGNIPVDDNGVSYEIHHKDFNWRNDDISNLECITIQEHYQRHYDAGQFHACAMIKRRMNMSEAQKKDLSEKIAIANKTKPNPMTNPESRKKLSRSLKERWSTHAFPLSGRIRPEHSQLMKDRGFGKNKTIEHQQNQVNAWIEATKNNPIRAMIWDVLKDGEVLKIKNLKKFCRDNKISYSKFYRKVEVNGYTLIGASA